MFYLKTVDITGFWGDKKVVINLNEHVNFLVGVNGSGKTTIINLIAACLKADHNSLDKIQFTNILLVLKDVISSSSHENYIEIKKDLGNSHVISYIIKNKLDAKGDQYYLSQEVDDEEMSYNIRIGQTNLFNDNQKLKKVLSELVSTSWLSINRSTNISMIRRLGEKNRNTTIDKKIYQLTNDFIKYCALLNSKSSEETSKFQEVIFLSLLNDDSEKVIFDYIKNTDITGEEEALGEIYKSFKLNEETYKNKLRKHFIVFKKASKSLENQTGLNTHELTALINTHRIHMVVQQWNQLVEKQKKIYESREFFIQLINGLFQRKKLIINKRNELLIETQSGKILTLYSLSSGEKQLFIIMCESLLQQNTPHIYIADEPELSLHVEWQEQLVKSLKALNHNSQIIFATHSPDIVGDYYEGVIHIEETITNE